MSFRMLPRETAQRIQTNLEGVVIDSGPLEQKNEFRRTITVEDEGTRLAITLWGRHACEELLLNRRYMFRNIQFQSRQVGNRRYPAAANAWYFASMTLLAPGTA